MRRPALVLVLMASCVGTGGLEVTDAWARPSPSVSDAGALYVTISNDGSEDDVLLSTQTDRCGTSQLHNTVMEDGVMSMVHVESLVVPSGGALLMEPGGLHVMCMGLTQPLEVGETFDVTLTFAEAGDRNIEVSVEDR